MSDQLLPDAPERLAALEARVSQALDYLGDRPANWVPPRDGIDRDVVIVGAGQAGLAIGFALKRDGVTNIELLDAAPKGQEGPWRTYARMETLRSPKDIPGPELGIADLTFRAWYEAAYGDAAYHAIYKIPTGAWMDYLLWYRDQVDLPIENDVRVTRVEPCDGGFRLHLDRSGTPGTLTARKLVLATGMDGFGRAFIPDMIREGLPPDRYAHCAEPVDFEALAGKRVAVLGAASSAFDYAGAALEAGAGKVDLFCRSAELYRYNRFKQINYPGVLHHYVDLDDADKWRIMAELMKRSVSIIRETLQRSTRYENFSIHLNAAWKAVTFSGDEIHIETEMGRHTADFAIIGAGFEMNPAARPELAGFADQIALWRDRYAPPAGMESEAAGAFPYLGSEFQLIERVPGAAPHLADIHLYNWAGSVSNGRGSSETTSIRHGVPRLVRALCRDLVRADADTHVARILSLPVAEFERDEYGAE
ncbi:MAG: SidA/IucD/PvdA family monooxygenase [Alphaproteobacteria bacterium]|nr:SidA/IucD/PvdA family monooxygenase [Alphaproteobacteria bacterium]